MTTDLLVLGGTVVNATGSSRADVAVEGGRIAAVEAGLGGLAASAREVVDATGLLVLPGVIDVHTHTRVASDDGARPVLPGLGGGGVRRHDDLPLVQQPGHRVLARGRSLAPHGPPGVAARPPRATRPWTSA